MVKLSGISGEEYEFEGCYSSTSSIADRSGVYVVLDKRMDGRLFVLDVGESSNPQYRLQNHDRKSCWENKRKGMIVYGIYYTPNLQQVGRKEVEQDIRGYYPNLCGDR